MNLDTLQKRTKPVVNKKGEIMKLKLNLILLCLIILSPLTTRAEIPDKVFAPYVDVTLWPTPSLYKMYEATGQKYFTLAFVLQGAECTPAWAGLSSLDMEFYQVQIEELRAVGGDVIISFGGANGTELALGCSDEGRILQAYQDVIDRYNLKWVDFDIEGWAVAERPSIDRRNRVIRQLQINNPDLKVAFCLPVLPQGLTHDGLYVIESAQNEGVSIDVVNVMAMDYGDSPAPNPEGQMGQYAIDAAQNTYNQLVNMGVDTTIGITPMIGQNDVPTERFYLQDAYELLNWAQATPWVSLLSMWSSSRDNGDCKPGTLSPKCSGITQDDFDFTNLFKEYTEGVSGGNLWPTVVLTSPTDGQTFEDNADVTIQATASDSDGLVSQVEFFNGRQSLGIDSDSPYSVVWQNVSGGSYDISAVAMDNEGAEARSSVVNILVGNNICQADAWDSRTIYVGGDTVSHDNQEWEAKWWTQSEEPGTTGEWGVWKNLGDCAGGSNQNQPPTSALTSPTNGTVFAAGDDVTIAATAADSDGTITQVEFFAGNESLGTINQSPYNIVWQNVAAGTYQLVAVATDDNGADTKSDSIGIIVSGGSPGLCADLLDYPAGIGSYTFGQKVQNNGSIYEVKPFPYGGWANLQAPYFYEPGAGVAWADAWIYVGSCD